ncbi:hypothetical protein C8Q75DRAFT_155554 [Abortiporus biennis]|nr:hypothetical protein C8Q75DRAFT_155554 [Abortiporus biennis]
MVLTCICLVFLHVSCLFSSSSDRYCAKVNHFFYLYTYAVSQQPQLYFVHRLAVAVLCHLSLCMEDTVYVPLVLEQFRRSRMTRIEGGGPVQDCNCMHPAYFDFCLRMIAKVIKIFIINPLSKLEVIIFERCSSFLLLFNYAMLFVRLNNLSFHSLL